MDIWIEQTQFHQIALKRFYISPLSKSEITLRNLLCYYQEIASKAYPKESKMEEALLNLYDAKFKVFLINYGTYNLFIYNLWAPDPKYIQDDAYTLDTLFKAFDDFCCAKMNQESADLNLFHRAYEIYESDLRSLKENTLDMAYQNMISHYFKNTSRDFDSFGSLNELKKITPKKLYQYYQKLLKEETISIGTGAYPSFKQIDSISLKPKRNYFFYEKNKNSLPLIQEKHPSNQCYMYIIYDINIYDNDAKASAAKVLNHILGASSNSYLFQKIREELGLCYSLSSTYSGSSGIFLISAVLSLKDVKKTLKTIDILLKDFKPKKIEIEQAKEYLVNQQLLENDFIDRAIFRYLIDHYFLDYPKTKDLVSKLQEVTYDDVMEVISMLQKRFIYILGGNHERKKL